MSTATIIDLAEHQDVRRGGHHDHRTRLDYNSFAELLADADRVVDDLTTSDLLLVTRVELEFTVRRLHALLRGAMRSAPLDVAKVP